MKLSLGYPGREAEQEILRRRRERKTDAIHLNAVTDVHNLLDLRGAIEEVFVDPDIEKYIVDLTIKTRDYRQVAIGASPRGSLALLKLSRSWAAMQGRAYILPDDVKLFAEDTLSHRLILAPDLWMVNRAANRIINEIIQTTPVPVIQEN